MAESEIATITQYTFMVAEISVNAEGTMVLFVDTNQMLRGLDVVETVGYLAS